VPPPGFRYRLPMPCRLLLLLALCLAPALFAARSARAESELRLTHPKAFGAVPASTYDTSRHRVGAAHVLLERLADESVRILAESGFDGGDHNVATALLVPSDDRRSLQPVLQESKTFRGDGSLRGTLSVDHRTRVASCGRSNGGEMAVERIELPELDRVANVALTLLFQPLVHGDTPSEEFQLFLCENGARLMDFEARVERRDTGAHGPGSLVEIRYRPDLGPVGSFIAAHLIPQLSYWFDPTTENSWVAHRIPLYSQGPEVIVVRDGVPTRWLTEAN
jgi:hypothetical protein